MTGFYKGDGKYGVIPYIKQITFNLWKVKNDLSSFLSLGYELRKYIPEKLVA